MVKPVEVDQLKELIEELYDRASGSHQTAAGEASAEAAKLTGNSS